MSTEPIIEDRNTKPGRKLEAFSWYSDDLRKNPHVRTLGTIKSLAGGVAILLEILEADDLNADDLACFGRVLDTRQAGSLMRLAITVSQCIEAECEASMDWEAEYGESRTTEQMPTTT